MADPTFKAVFVNFFVFPGAGYFVLKKRVRGAVSALIVATCLGFVLFEAQVKADIVAEKINSGAIPMSLASMTSELRLVPSPLSRSKQIFIYALLATTWVLSTLDCFRVGRRLRPTEVSKETY